MIIIRADFESLSRPHYSETRNMLLLLVSFLFATAHGLSPPAANPAMDAHFPSLSISNSSNV